jgi:hypothetical protein
MWNQSPGGYCRDCAAFVGLLRHRASGDPLLSTGQQDKLRKHTVPGLYPSASVFTNLTSDDYDTFMRRAREEGFVYVDLLKRRNFILPVGSQIGVDQLNGQPCDAFLSVLSSGERVMHRFPVRVGAYPSVCISCRTVLHGQRSTST